jgi:HEAT repeat protein
MIGLLMYLVIFLVLVAGCAFLVFRFGLNAHQKAQILLFVGQKEDAEFELVEGIDHIKNKEILLKVIKTLVHLQVKRSVPKLIKQLREPDPDIKCAAAEALGVFQDSRSIEPLIALKDDRDRAVRMSVLWALSTHKKEAVAPVLVDMIREKDETICMIICDLIADMGASVIPRLEEVIAQNPTDRAGHEETIVKVISILKKIDDKSCAEILIRLLKSESRAIREKAAEALGELFSTQSLDALKALLTDESNYVREAAEKAIGLIENRGGDNDGVIQKSKEKQMIENSIGKFRGVSKHKNKKFALDAVYRLQKIGSAAVVDLLDALEDKDPDVKKYVIISLGLIRDPQAVPALEKMAKNRDPGIAAEAKTALEKIRETSSVNAPAAQESVG